MKNQFLTHLIAEFPMADLCEYYLYDSQIFDNFEDARKYGTEMTKKQKDNPEANNAMFCIIEQWYDIDENFCINAEIVSYKIFNIDGDLYFDSSICDMRKARYCIGDNLLSQFG